MIDPHIFKFPLSLILAGVTVNLILILKRTKVAGIFSNNIVSVSLMVIAAILTAIEGTWSLGLFHHWSFITVAVLLLFSLGFAVTGDYERKSHIALLSHLGLFLVLYGGLFSAADVKEGHIRIFEGEKEHIAVDSRGNLLPLPFEIELKDFSIDYYEDGRSPKQFSSALSIDGRDFLTGVNHPCRYKGYGIYQSGYDMESGSYTILKVVKDMWLPILALGAVLLVIASAFSLKKTWNSWKVLIAALVLAALFTAISVAKINFGTLMPALRSLWFIPHLAIYMLAYAIMAFATIMGVSSFFSKKDHAGTARKLLSTASSLLLIGMICGAVWAKQAWGDYWTWDAKECWAAVTWLLTLAGTHIRTSRKRTMAILAIAAFIAMQITWYGVNYLPSATASLHTYNQ